jgi:hypothetical protein
MSLSSFFYEIEIKSLLEWSLYSFLKKKLSNEYGWLKEEKNMSTQVFAPGRYTLRYNTDDVYVINKSERDRLCKKIEIEEIGRSGYPTKIRELEKQGMRVVMEWDSSKDIYQTMYGDFMYEIHLESFPNWGQMLKVRYESKEKPNLEEHVLLMRKVAVDLGVDPIPPSQFKNRVSEYNKRFRYSS